MAGQNLKIGGGGFHHIALKAANFEKSVKFYTEGLGFLISMSWGEGNGRAVMLDTGDGNFLELFAGGAPGEKPEGSLLHMAFRTDNCDMALNQAIAAGAVVTKEPFDVDIKSDPVTPVRIAFCKGFDGEVIEFFQYR